MFSLRHVCRAGLICAALAAAFAPAARAAIEPSTSTVTAITVSGNRVREDVIRGQLAFREGDELTDAALEKSRQNLYSLGLFKSLDIRCEPDAARPGVRVDIAVKDGWFLFPWPMFGSRGGENYAGGMLMEQNVFRRAERVMFFGNYQQSAQMSVCTVMSGKNSLVLMANRRSHTEYLYADHAYNTFGKDSDDPSTYGVVADSYERTSDEVRLILNRKLWEDVTLGLGANVSDTHYRNALVSLPDGGGETRSLTAQLTFGKPEYQAGRDLAFNFGRIAGLGMADMAENLKKRVPGKTEYTVVAGFEKGYAAIGSEADFCKITGGITRTSTFPGRSRLQAALKGGQGIYLPSGELFTTGRREGLKGQYAREFRGDRYALASASFRYPFMINHAGQLHGEIFAEAARCWFEGGEGEKRGAGCNLTWTFWRFPLPLGMGYTYSFDDRDWQGTFAVGGMF